MRRVFVLSLCFARVGALRGVSVARCVLIVVGVVVGCGRGFVAAVLGLSLCVVVVLVVCGWHCVLRCCAMSAFVVGCCVVV